MANPTLSIAIDMFRDIYISKYQSMEKLAGTSIEVMGIVGKSYKWPLLGNAEMGDRGAYQSIVGNTMLDHTQVTTTFDDKVLRVAIDHGEEALINASERQLWALKLAGATGRQKDQHKIAALDAASTNVIVNGGTNMSLDKLILAQEKLLKGNVEGGSRVIAIHANQLSALLKETKVTSADYATVRALVNGEINTFMGFRFIVFGDRTNGALPKAGNIRSCFAWNTEAIGSVYCDVGPQSIDVYESKLHMSWLADVRLVGGASALQEEGIVKIDCDETA